MIADAINLHVDPVRMQMPFTKQITISHVFDSDGIKSKDILVDEKLSQVYSTDESEPESVIVNEISTEEKN